MSPLSMWFDATSILFDSTRPWESLRIDSNFYRNDTELATGTRRGYQYLRNMEPGILIGEIASSFWLLFVVFWYKTSWNYLPVLAGRWLLFIFMYKSIYMAWQLIILSLPDPIINPIERVELRTRAPFSHMYISHIISMLSSAASWTLEDSHSSTCSFLLHLKKF